MMSASLRATNKPYTCTPSSFLPPEPSRCPSAYPTAFTNAKSNTDSSEISIACWIYGSKLGRDPPADRRVYAASLLRAIAGNPVHLENDRCRSRVVDPAQQVASNPLTS